MQITSPLKKLCGKKKDIQERNNTQNKRTRTKSKCTQLKLLFSSLVVVVVGQGKGSVKLITEPGNLKI